MSYPYRKLGLIPSNDKTKIPCLSDYLDRASLFPAVEPKGWQYAVAPDDIGMLGNDQWGDCVPASVMHSIAVRKANVGNKYYPTTEQTLALYSAVTGFDPDAGPSGQNPTDQGTEPAAMIAYWKNTGVDLGNGSLDKIAGAALVNPLSVAELRYANYLFGGLLYAVQLPQSAEADVSNWAYVPGSPIVGGHGVNGTAEGSAGGHLQSWGLNIPFTWEFIQRYAIEVYAVADADWVNDNTGKTPTGLDLDGLLKAMAAL